jgi:hypothetical protein
MSEINVAQPGRSQSSATVSGMETYVARLGSPPPTSNYTSNQRLERASAIGW